MKKFAVALSVCLAVGGACAQANPHARAERIGRAMGIEQQLVALHQSNLAGVREQAAMLVAQLEKAGVKEKQLAELTPSIEKLLTLCGTSWDAKVAARIYAEGLVDVLSEADLREAEKYYLSPKGARTHAALVASQERMLKYIQQESAKAMEPAMQEFFAEVKRLASSQGQ